MKRGERVSETHIMVLRYPSQGHINPMLQFSRRLASKGPRVTLVIPTASIYNAQASSINIEIICEGLEKRKEEERTEDYVERFRMVASQSLAELIEKHSRSSHSAKILVYDSFMPWAQDVATRLGLDGAAFFTQSCAVSVIYYLVNQGALNMPLEGEVASMPWMPVLCINDLPSIIDGKSSDTTALSFLLKVKWILFNTYDKLEDEVINWMASQRPIRAIGPTVPSMYLDKMLEDDRDYGLSLFKQNADSCITWLDTKGSGSVVYVSFGSMASQGKEQMEELAWGLRKSNTHFMWVVRESKEKKIPSNFLEETSERGLVVSWCPQLEVLAHKAVGCFLTHCGWNSTLEALSLGVPMIAMPQFLDQTTNARFVEDVWRVGVRVKADEKGIDKKEEIEMCIREIMEGERGNEMKTNAQRWRELAKEAVTEGGSSFKNIEEFVTEILCS
ncbi:mogroside IE synthase-like [Vitis vinifera]|nr:mogroside IE synthase-like [Vitis vinifera]|eukprot:XP_019075481.1 PREDICTED: UDP-glycosyltransferase 74E2-like [Vitis vinifera]